MSVAAGQLEAAIDTGGWQGRLLRADTARAVGETITSLARALPGVAAARLSWELAPATESAGDPADLALADEAMIQGRPLASDDGRRLAIPLRVSTAVLVLELLQGVARDHLVAAMARPLALADRHLHERRRLVEQERELLRLRHSERVQRALFDISELAGSAKPMDEMLRGIHGIVGSLMYAENFFIVLRNLDGPRICFLYYADVEDEQPEPEQDLAAIHQSLTWYLLHDARPLRGDDAMLRRQVSGPLQLVGSNSHDWLGVPMLRDGEAMGAVVVQSYTPDIGYNEDDQALLEFVASHILNALERRRSTQLLERDVALRTQELAEANAVLRREVAERERAERLQAALFQIAQLATADIDEQQFHANVHAIVGQLLIADNFYIAMLSEDRQLLRFPYYVDSRHLQPRPERALGRGLTEYVLRTREPLLGTGEMVARLERADAIEYRAIQGPPAECWLGVPLFFGEEAVGVVALQSYEVGVGYTPADQELLSFVASQIANSLHRRHSARALQHAYARLEERVAERTVELQAQIHERERVQGQLEHELMHDALTGVPNRGQLHQHIDALLRRLQTEPARHCALLYLDVDRFKVINDSLGHLAGDDFLREVARRLQASVRGPDLVARISGDEFAILIDDVQRDPRGPAAAATAVAQRVMDLLTEPLHIAGRTLEPSASIGIAISRAGYRHADELMRDADIALYRAKTLGRKRWQLFDESLQRSAIDVLTMETDLRSALQHDHIEPYFQPIVRLSDGGVVGHEALLRWNHPTRGVLAPGAFLQIAEESGVIEDIDWRMFKRSCAIAARCGQGHYLSINVSPRHLVHDDFDARLLQVVQRSGLDPARLLIEVTEGSLLENPERVRAILARLQAHGIGVALDDFGTGYSSLSYLHTFPLRVLKIDRTFLASLGTQSNSAAVISAVLALARALGIGVVAEGIETEEQRRALLALGCEFGQGYLFGRPVPAPASLTLGC